MSFYSPMPTCLNPMLSNLAAATESSIQLQLSGCSERGQRAPAGSGIVKDEGSAPK